MTQMSRNAMDPPALEVLTLSDVPQPNAARQQAELDPKLNSNVTADYVTM